MKCLVCTLKHLFLWKQREVLPSSYWSGRRGIWENRSFYVFSKHLLKVSHIYTFRQCFYKIWQLLQSWWSTFSILHLLSSIQDLFLLAPVALPFWIRSSCHLQLSQMNVLLSLILTEPFKTNLMYIVARVCACFSLLVQNTSWIFYYVVLTLLWLSQYSEEGRGVNWG